MNLNKEEIEKCNDPSELGDMLRNAAKKGELDLVKLIISKDMVDINYNGADKVFVCKPTPLQCAVIGGNLDIVKLLLQNGADISITDKWGYRPFNEAVEASNDRWCHRAYNKSAGKDDKEILKLIKSCEPKEWHQREWCIERLKKLGLPNDAIEFLGSENRRVDLQESEWTNYVKFYALDEVRTFKWKDMTFVDLVYDIDDYGNIGVISWIPEHKSFACLDMEHEMFGFIKEMTWNEFMKNPTKFIDGSLSWEFFDLDCEE